MIRAILTDIEGTISSLEYVKSILFPYSRARLEEFLKKHWEEEAIKGIIEKLQDKLQRPVNLKVAVEVFGDWVDKDLKEPTLKELQGHIWEEGFLKGELKGHIYEDAYSKLREWKKKGYKLYVYSSGSVKAQRLFFAHSQYGDLRELFDGFFDTSVGGKRERESYLRIADTAGLLPEEFIFLSDVKEELDAARYSGMNTILVSRNGLTEGGLHRVISNFSELEL
ncbi:MAG: acireductone synthase [Aquificaceae bacterium]|nr:acireductone synthase [Aquificaceae bacterium]MCX8163995.1 acireductone synthase [Aquificaceae bacterium]